VTIEEMINLLENVKPHNNLPTVKLLVGEARQIIAALRAGQQMRESVHRCDPVAEAWDAATGGGEND
jgi:DNA-directed RNA polymerase subunit H (RpoH/RPB5)